MTAICLPSALSGLYAAEAEVHPEPWRCINTTSPLSAPPWSGLPTVRRALNDRAPTRLCTSGWAARAIIRAAHIRSICMFRRSFGVAGARTTRGPYSLVRSCGTSLAPVLAAASGRVGRTGPDGGWAGPAAIRASNGTATNTPPGRAQRRARLRLDLRPGTSREVSTEACAAVASAVVVMGSSFAGAVMQQPRPQPGR
jgi:hypothetical protein